MSVPPKGGEAATVPCMIIEHNQNRLFDVQKSHFAYFAFCEMENILVHVFLLMIFIFDHGGGQ